jgi:thioesterase domain-containing protein
VQLQGVGMIEAFRRGRNPSSLKISSAALRRYALAGVLAATGSILLPLGPQSSLARSPTQRTVAVQSRPHVYLLRGLMNIFSLGMDELATEIQRAGIPATAEPYTNGDALVAQLTAGYRAGDRGPIILIGHSLGADAVMQMAQMLNRNNVPVALLVPFDGTQSFRAPKNVARVLNLTQREYAYMRPGAGFHGTLKNVDVSGDPNIDHITIDKSPRLHAMVLSYVRGVVGAERKHESSSVSAAKHTTPEPAAPAAKEPAPQTSVPQPAQPTLRGRLEEKAEPAG